LGFGTQKLSWTRGSGEEDVKFDGVGKPAIMEEGDASPDII
jgi:hypothetical protein